ncbi:phage holin family protein [Isoptericola halotolerans]|uniref:Membrane protein n=1 Tax=Isoptericola halotolerans TaxID=300560 RepID=A0ABX1ZYM8_9MICO|nr:phage holin family protein [Isoptericola halotolerans]NOV95707.1 putative membrane protein [Isoptericola halotolerans]
MNLIARIVVTSLALWICDLIFDNLEIYGGNDTLGQILVVLAVATIFSLVSMIVKPIVSLISLPLLILTLGLFYLLINAFMLWITTWITSLVGDWGLEIEGGFWWYLWIALILAVLQTVIGWVIPGKRD